MTATSLPVRRGRERTAAQVDGSQPEKEPRNRDDRRFTFIAFRHSVFTGVSVEAGWAAPPASLSPEMVLRPCGLLVRFLLSSTVESALRREGWSVGWLPSAGAG
jgi:hypothetical protein